VEESSSAGRFTAILSDSAMLSGFSVRRVTRV
jgi:hypothetical protein